MITVKIELWPRGREDRAREIGRMYIANDGRASVTDPSRGDYLVGVCRRGTTDVPREIYGEDAGPGDEPKAARAAEVKNYPRLAYNVWRLIARAVLAAFPEEAKRAKRDERTLLDAQVMRGLELLEDHMNPNADMGSADTEAVNAACDWLSAAFEDLGAAKRGETVPDYGVGDGKHYR